MGHDRRVYAAVDYVEAYLADFDVHSTGPEHRAFNLRAAPDDVFVAYRWLYDRSRSARYDGATFAPAFVRDTVLADRLRLVKTVL